MTKEDYAALELICDRIEDAGKRDYDLDDLGDLAYSLYEQGVLTASMSISQMTAICAQHVKQA